MGVQKIAGIRITDGRDGKPYDTSFATEVSYIIFAFSLVLWKRNESPIIYWRRNYCMLLLPNNAFTSLQSMNSITVWWKTCEDVFHSNNWLIWFEFTISIETKKCGEKLVHTCESISQPNNGAYNMRTYGFNQGFKQCVAYHVTTDTDHLVIIHLKFEVPHRKYDVSQKQRVFAYMWVSMYLCRTHVYRCVSVSMYTWIFVCMYIVYICVLVQGENFMCYAVTMCFSI